MSTFGTDTSKFQPPGSYDPGAFEIVNAEDPTMPIKVGRNILEGRPWGFYVWVNPGESGSSMVNRARAAIQHVGATPPLWVWWDYEEKGVNQGQLHDVFQVADSVGMPSGYYSNAGTVNHSEFLGYEYWQAQFPRPNDGSFPGLDRMDTPRDVTIWQYSSGGGLDRDVIIDNDWYVRRTGEDDMPTIDELIKAMFEPTEFGVSRVNAAVRQELKPVLDSVASWENDTRAQIIAAVNKHVDEKLAGITAQGGSARTDAEITALVKAAINETKLSSG